MTNIYNSVCLPYLFIVNENHNHRLSWIWCGSVIQSNIQTEKSFWRLPQKHFVDILSNPRWDPAPSPTALSCFFSNFTWKGLIRKICHPSSNIFGHSNYNTLSISAGFVLLSEPHGTEIWNWFCNDLTNSSTLSLFFSKAATKLLDCADNIQIKIYFKTQHICIFAMISPQYAYVESCLPIWHLNVFI